MCSPDRLRACFREPEMFDITLLDEITHRSGNLFNRHFWVNAKAAVAPTKSSARDTSAPNSWR
jgi:hypothetical protein